MHVRFDDPQAASFFCAAKRNEPKKRQFKGEKDARNGDTNFSPLKIPLSSEEGKGKKTRFGEIQSQNPVNRQLRL